VKRTYTADALLSCPPVDDPLTYQEITSATRFIRSKTAPGPDDIHPLFVKGAKKNTVDAICVVFNFWRLAASKHYGDLQGQGLPLGPVFL